MYYRYLAVIFLLLLLASCKKMDTNALSINAISPSTGFGGNLVTVTGSGFSADRTQDVVTINGLPADVITASVSQLVIQLPNGAATGPIVVGVNGRRATGPVYTVTAMTIASFTPTSGAAGTRVTVTGTGFLNTGKLGSRADLPVVYFNGRPAITDSSSATTLVVTVPDSAGNGLVTVRLDSVTVTGANFYFLGLNSVRPLTGNVGTHITLLGGFGTTPDQSTITIGGKPIRIDSASPGRLSATILAGDTTGRVSLNAGGQSFSGPIFTFVPPPTILSLLPSSGPAGTKIIIKGTNFSAIDSENVVTFGGVRAKVLAAAGNRLTVSSPTSIGTVPVVVNVNGQTVNAGTYIYQAVGLSAIAPNLGNAGIPVVISGIGFSTVTAQDMVTFNGLAGQVTAATDTTLTVLTPAGVTTGPVQVTVNGVTAMGLTFTFTLGAISTVTSNLDYPAGLAIDANGNIFVAEYHQNIVKKITPDGAISTFATGFSYPINLIFDGSGYLFVSDWNGGKIKKITPDGTLTVFEDYQGNSEYLSCVAIDPSGYIYFVDNSGGSENNLYKFDQSGNYLSTISYPNASKIYGAVFDAQGNVYVTDQNQGVLYKNQDIIVSGMGMPEDITIDNNKNRLLIADPTNNVIYSVDLSDNTLKVLVGGNGSNQAGYVDGPNAAALFNGPTGVKVGADGSIYVADEGNHAVRKIVGL